MTAFFHPHNLIESLIIYAAIAIIAATVCGAIALFEEGRKRRAGKTGSGENDKINLKV